MLGRKRVIVVIAMLASTIFLCACGIGTVTGKVDLNYGDTYKIEHEKLKGRELVWSSTDEQIATVEKSVVTANAPGEAVIFAKEGEKTVAKYTVSVTAVLATNIVLSSNNYEITEGESTAISYTLFPNNACNYGLEWKSADVSVAKVDETGHIDAIAPGQTTISVTNDEGLFATCSVIVKKALPNFKTLYSKWENEPWFSVSDDGTWMRFDTNPNNDDGDDYWKYMTEMEAVDTNLPSVLEELGYNSAIFEKMNHTTWSMGQQTASTDTTTATWTYHPDKGLEVLFEVNK